ncbi:MAG TPA: HD domain-containing phosphohydrolase [Thermoanaerobaculia bacterium]|jgi:response regulator RpfG family c-di-GMP phosphodiesterase
MLSELKTIEAQLKQILYGCVEHVQATKAALYLSASHDLNAKTFEVVTSYQYNAADRRVVTANDDLVDRLSVKRSPFFVNGVGTDQRFAEILFRQGNDRLLVTPIFSRGRLAGFIDMRDKAARKPFDDRDVEAARKIAEQMSAVLGAHKLFGLGAIPISDDPLRITGNNLVRATPSAPPPTDPAVPPGQVFTPEATRAIEAARQYMARRQHAAQSGGRRILGEGDLDVLRLLLPSALGIPYAVVASISAAGQVHNPIAIAARSTLADDAMTAVLAHVQETLKRGNHPHVTKATQVAHPFGVHATPLTAANLSTIVSGPVNPQSIDGVVLTVAFDRAPEAHAQRALQIFLREIEPMVEAAVATTAGRNDRLAIAERLLEPDFQKYPALAEHSREVSFIAQRFARALELPATQVETVRIAALVHDVGLRLLDYGRMYKRPNLTPEEMRGLNDHPVVGAAMVEPLLGPEVAHAVLRHHERVDGKGYPSRMSGQQIPLASRIIQIADTWVAMTAQQSYKQPVAREKAMVALRDGAGTQFDAALVERFLRALAEIVP